ncbi:olfactory receptor [Sarotherodon galilaeus]
MHQNSEQHSNTFSSQRADIPATTSAPQQFVSTSPIQSQRSRNTTLNMTTPHSYSSVETWKSLSDYFFGAIVPQWRSLQLNPEYCNTKLPSTLLKDMLKLCSMLMDATETTMEKGAPVSTQTEECLQSVGADSHEKTEVTGAKEGIVTEISVDNCGDNKKPDTPELETEASACLQHVDTQSQTTATAEPRKSCMKKKSTADTKDLDKIEPCPMKKPAMPAAYESDIDNRKETEAKGAKDSILKEISVDNCGDNKKTETPELETEASASLQRVDTQSQTTATAEPRKSCMKKKSTADTKDLDKIEPCPMKKPAMPAAYESDIDNRKETEAKGAKDSILKEISVDNCGDNKKTETPELETEASASLQRVDTQSQTTATAEPRKSCMKKKSTADTKDLDKIEPCAMKKPAMPAAYESDVDNRKETEAKGAKDSILKEISVDNCGDNKKTDTPELETEAGKCLQHVDTQSQTTAEPKKSCMKKEPPADTKDWDKIEACPVEKPVIPAVHESEVDSSSVISLASDDLSAEKTYVYAVIQLVVSRALKKVSSKHKDSTWILTPKSNCHRLLEKIWPEIEGKHLDLSPKRLTSIEKAIFTNLCKAHKCKEKHLISSLKEELEDDITVPTFTKHLLALPKRVLTLSKNRDEYRELVERFARDLVMHAMSNIKGLKKWRPAEEVIQRLTEKFWAKIVSQNLEISLENMEDLTVRVYNELQKKWRGADNVLWLMHNGNPRLDKMLVRIFKSKAPLRRPNIFSRLFSCVR